MVFSRWIQKLVGPARYAAAILLVLMASAARGALSVELTAGPSLGMLPPATSAAIMSGVAAAASRWSGIISESVTLKYTVDYDPMLPALGAAFDVYVPVPYDTGSGGGVKPALIGKASSAYDATATTKLQSGSSLKLWINDMSVPPSFPPHIDADGSVNNMIMDISRAHMKGLGLLPPADGGPGADGTIKIGSAAFDFDPSDGIDAGKYDFVAVALHEMAHSLGFISGVDTLATLVPPPPPMGPGPDATAMVTVLDLFRYSSDSYGIDPGGFVPDMSLPVPGFSSTRYFSIDGGVTPIELFSTGTKLAGDLKQAGHWKDFGSFKLMKPDLAAGFAATDAFDALVAGGAPVPDLIALDVIGWTIVSVPEGSPFRFGCLMCGAIGVLHLSSRHREIRGPRA